MKAVSDAPASSRPGARELQLPSDERNLGAEERAGQDTERDSELGPLLDVHKAKELRQSDLTTYVID